MVDFILIWYSNVVFLWGRRNRKDAEGNDFYARVKPVAPVVPKVIYVPWRVFTGGFILTRLFYKKWG